jgi:hypothetical protein
MPMQLILLVAAIAVSWLLFTALVKILKTTVSTALMVAAVFLIAQLGFGVKPLELWTEVTTLPQTLFQFFQQNRS